MKMLICIMKYLHPDKRYGLDTISIYKINEKCIPLKIGTRDMVLVFCSSCYVAPSLNQVS